MTALYQVDLPPEILARGFWLYVWKMVGPQNELFCYVGMTGDVTGVAQSPFARAGSHFGSNQKGNAIRRHLAAKSIEPENCKVIKQFVFGPIFPYWHSAPRHPDFDDCRRKVAALERKLWLFLHQAGFSMLNKKPGGSDAYDQQKWVDVQRAFAPLFDLAIE